jgi:hypothetical protein
MWKWIRNFLRIGMTKALGEALSLLERALKMAEESNQLSLSLIEIIHQYEKLEAERKSVPINAVAPVEKPRLNCERDYGFACRDTQIQLGYKKDTIN